MVMHLSPESLADAKYSLSIVQQPIRARMCGYGGNDRRPISPPLIVKLECLVDGQSFEPIEWTSMVLAVDLRYPNLEDANLIPPLTPRSARFRNTLLDPLGSSTARHTTSASTSPPFESPRLKKQRRSTSQDPASVSTASLSRDTPRSAPSSSAPTSNIGTIPNLIGTLHSSGHILKNLEGEKGFYFVLPELSVRIAGSYCLRLRLLSIGGSSTRGSGSPILALTYTQDFKVHSAKKFEGMLDPTPISKHFVSQGVRIPTRQHKGK